MAKPLWQLLLKDPANLTCDECFAVIEYYAEGLARSGADLLPKVIEHLKRCPQCELQHRDALRRLLAGRSESNAASLSDLSGSDGSDAKG